MFLLTEKCDLSSKNLKCFLPLNLLVFNCGKKMRPNHQEYILYMLFYTLHLNSPLSWIEPRGGGSYCNLVGTNSFNWGKLLLQFDLKNTPIEIQNFVKTWFGCAWTLPSSSATTAHSSKKLILFESLLNQTLVEFEFRIRRPNSK